MVQRFALAQDRSWHRAEGLGGATIATAIQGYNRHAERVPVMPALDPQQTMDTRSILDRPRFAYMG